MRKKIYYVLKGILRDELLSPSIAEKLSTKLIFAIKALGEMPMRCSLCEYEQWRKLGLRFLSVDNYLVFYLPDEKHKIVKIYRFIYGRRDIENQLK